VLVCGFFATSTARAASEPLEVRLLRTIHLGALQEVAADDLLRLSGTSPGSLRSVLARTALLVLEREAGASGPPVETLLDQAFSRLEPRTGLLPPGAPPGFGGDDLIYTLTYALTVSRQADTAIRVLERHVDLGTEYERSVALQALHNIGSVRAQVAIRRAVAVREIGFLANALLVEDQFPKLEELAAHWHDIPLARRSRAELLHDLADGCSSRAILAFFLAGYLPPAATPVQERAEQRDLYRAALELPLRGCYNGRMFALRSYGLRSHGVPVIWAALATRLETGWQRVLAARIGFARFPRDFVPMALDRLAVEPEQDVQWELLWGSLCAGKGVVFRDFWDLWSLAPHRQFRLSHPGSFPRLTLADQQRLLTWLETGHRPGDRQVYDWLLCELSRSAFGSEAFRVLRAYLARPLADRHEWVLTDLAEPATLPVLRYLRDHAANKEDKDSLAGGIQVLEEGSGNLYTGLSPVICCDPTPACLLAQYDRQLFRLPGRFLRNETEVAAWVQSGLTGKPVIKMLDSRLAEVHDPLTGQDLRFEHRAGCWKWIQSGAEEPVYPVGGDVLAPQQISACQPQLPESMQGQEIEQPLFIYEVVISAAGKVKSVKLVRRNPRGEPYDSLEKAFRQAIETCAYRPATRQGKPVACRMTMTATAEVR
jgi:hypothetical protein